jgi:hypothetical protein
MMEQEFVKREPLREPYRFNWGGEIKALILRGMRALNIA